jgi:hypothetical protein
MAATVMDEAGVARRRSRVASLRAARVPVWSVPVIAMATLDDPRLLLPKDDLIRTIDRLQLEVAALKRIQAETFRVIKSVRSLLLAALEER